MFPYFIPGSQIIGNEFIGHILFLRRKGEKDYKVIVQIKDVKKIESAINQLLNNNN